MMKFSAVVASRRSVRGFWSFLLPLLLAVGSMMSSNRLRADAPPTEGELIERFSTRREEFRRLDALLSRQGGVVFGPRYGEYARLKEAVGIRTFQGTGGQQKLGLRFPVVLRTDLFQFTRGGTRGYAWLPNPPALLAAESGRVHRLRGEPETVFLYTGPRQPLPETPPRADRGQYSIALRRLEGPWYLYADNGPFHAGW